MANNTVLNPGALGDTIATEDIGGVKYELVKLLFGGNGVATKVDAANPLPVIDAVAEAALTSIAAEDFATQATLAALLAKVITAPSTEAKQDAMVTLLTTIATITQPLTDTQLRATPVPVSGTVTTSGLTDAQLRATPVPVSATDLDVRDLVFATDKVDASGTVLGAGTNNIGDVDVATLPALIAGTALIGKVGIDQTTDGTTNKVRATGTASFTDATVVVLAVTALQSIASSATVGWQSVLVKNHVTKYNDFKIWVKLTTANTAPANDKAMYVWIIPWYTSDNGTTWNPSSIGTVTLPTGTDAAMTIASPHNLRLLGVLNYTTAQAIVQDTFLLSNCFGNRMPDGFSVGVTNFSGAALSTSCIVDYTGINDTLI